MNGPVVILLLVLAVIPLFLLVLRLDAWLTEREYQRLQRGDETRPYADARAALRRQLDPNPGHVRLGTRPRKDPDL